ncbi:hypothetical protein LVW35_17790 [Pseudomonas sp. HN11]|uniref:hypothetical protein n=1 Tax=Pseudomonas sp. HN11 TaxID=1344094 RepID=UPI001F16018D|nr:hypothetical protein LVW35_17790 [Pseudomonas sp. HN11]
MLVMTGALLTSLMAFLLGTAPLLQDPTHLIGTRPAISMALTGFSNLALVAGALTPPRPRTRGWCCCCCRVSA